MTDDVITHSSGFRVRRFLNWFPLGLTYAFLYMGRYNLTVAKNALGELMTKEDFGIIFGAGTLVYAFAFVLNGPLTDKIGGKKAMLMAAGGTLAANLALGLYVRSLLGVGASGDTSGLRTVFTVIYAANMYFQSFGAVAIVKVNAHWFHVRERGGFSGIFGTMISSGIFFAFTVNGWILDLAGKLGVGKLAASQWVFFAPAALLGLMFVIELFLLKDRPGQAGHEDFDTGDASSGEEGDLPVFALMKKILTNPIILTVAAIELCTGVLRQAVMHWYPIYSKEVLALPGSHYMRDGSWGHWWTIWPFFGVAAVMFVAGSILLKGKARPIVFTVAGLLFLAPFLQGGWGGILMVAGVIGGNVAGWLSDAFFQSRRAPTAGFLYLLCAASAVLMIFSLGDTTARVSWSKVDAEEGFDALRVGDEIVAIAGVRRPERWSDVARAVACLPGECQGGARWDAERCMCATSPEREDSSLRPGDGSIAATVMRGGRRLELRLKDPAARMRAGDVRVLKAGPVVTVNPLWLGIAVFLISLSVIGTHGLLSGTATMDFGGRKGAATAVGMIDGAVYLGTAIQSISLGYLTTRSWAFWPPFLLPFAVAGFVLLLRIWKVVPKGKSKGH